MKFTILIKISLLIFPSLITMSYADINITYSIRTDQERKSISRYIYGTNFSMTNSENLTVQRMGGNRLTGYNWENNYSNAGSDWYHHSDHYLVRNIPQSQRLIPGMAMRAFHESCIAAGQASIITLQMAGYVSADGAGTVDESETAPSSRWKQVLFTKGDSFCYPADNPDKSDDYVYMDECVNFLVNRYGQASTSTGVKFYCLDNEPALWSSTHSRIHPDKISCSELINRTVSLSEAVKDIDPNAIIIGPVLYGFNAYLSLQGAPDWDDQENGYGWFLDYYLDKIATASAIQGRRLVDILDLHWYPEAKGDGLRITESSDSYTRQNAWARMQAPRTLWDPDYVEDSWIGQWFSHHLPLLPNVIESVNTFYPGTKISITEFSYGAPNHISGGIAMADVLGIFAKYGLFLSTYWHLGEDYDYVSAAYRIYRNYDRAYSTFGDTIVDASMSDKVNSSIYASTFENNDSELHLIVINKNFDEPINGLFNISGPEQFKSARVWAFDESESEIKEISPINSISDNSFTYRLDPLTVCHMVIQAKCPAGDINGDCHVTIEDLLYLASQWLQDNCSDEICSDLNNDNSINESDFAIIAENWGR